MGSSNRAAPPAPLHTTTSTAYGQGAASRASYDSTPRSPGSFASSSLDREDSGSSHASSSRPNRKSSQNVYTHCGRHSDQYLFKGWGDMVKTVLHRKEN